MAIRTNYNFKGVEIKDVTIRIARIFGSSSEGWNSLVNVCVNNSSVESVIDCFNHHTEYMEDERGYVSLYNSLTEIFGGIEI